MNAPIATNEGLRPRRRKLALSAVSMGMTAALAVGCGSGGSVDDADWPQDPVQFVVPAGAGGAMDTAFRELQPYLEEELGQPLEVEYREGGQLTVGTTYVHQNGGECEPFLIQGIPDLIFPPLTRSLEYEYDDFSPIAGFTIEPTALWVRDDAPWDTIEDLIDDARDRPGEIRFSVSSLMSASYIALLRLQEQADVEFNIISYDGGGPGRNALIAGEVEGTMAGVFAAQTIAEDARPLALFQEENQWGDLTENAPTINDELDLGLDDSAERYAFFASSQCSEEHPERFQTLADAAERAMANEDYQATLAENDEVDKVVYEGPEEFDEYAREQIEVITEMYNDQPELFGDQ